MPRSSLFAICLGIFVGAGLPASAIGEERGAVRAGAFSFDIPAQPLASALERYGDATGREVLYSTSLVQGRYSRVVEGVFTPETALQRMLDGTGLSASFLADESFVLVPATTPRPSADGVASPALQQQYYARIQTSLQDAFCGNNSARAGGYRVAVKFWIDPSGMVSRHERLGSTGRPDLDSRIDETLRLLRIGAPPPQGFLQPVLIMIVPEAPGVTMGCGTDAVGARRARVGP
jgi:TonB family protein